uniref:Uncharacterized protein n=1 Tax=Craspedostauros australis TaxID=1486917 RepID=A0A7R9WN70_9STRA|mmetsp:Transcript_11335/g.31377  ORF Transcript_11335/g.31377 Transcript_11335/m.31377 type:complete len:120 (+) Transcript_11335:124-483(+)
MMNRLLIAAAVASTATAFAPMMPRNAGSALSVANEGIGGLEQIEFKIFPDGRVEEVVRGVKGGDCHKVTEKINNMLGKVVETKPTEEMYEQKLVVDQTLTESVDSNSDGNGGWDGQSTW